MMNRRNFMQAAAGTAFSAAVGAQFLSFPQNAQAASDFAVRPKIALLGRLPDAEAIAKMKEIGIEGMEISGSVTLEEAKAARKMAEAQGFCFHSMMGGGSIERLEVAAEIGADAVLVVPGRVSGVKMPEPWEFKIEFDEKTNRLISVVEGDNTPYTDYIRLHNEQMESARKKVEALIPKAQELGITLGLENVWNNMWVHPAFAANFIKSFGTKTVQAYFDCGNNMKYYPRSQDWFDHLKGQIIRVHIKDFLMNPDGRGGKFARVMEGSVDWLAVRQKMIETGFSTWITVELQGCPLTHEEQADRMTRILDGRPLA